MPENERRLLSKVMPGLLCRGGLQDLAAATLERTLTADPDDADALWKLAEVYRRLRDFDVARGLYGRLRVRGPDPCGLPLRQPPSWTPARARPRPAQGRLAARGAERRRSAGRSAGRRLVARAVHVDDGFPGAGGMRSPAGTR